MPIMRSVSQQTVVKKTNTSTIRERKIIYEGSASPRELLEAISLQAQAALKVFPLFLFGTLEADSMSRDWKAQSLLRIHRPNLMKNRSEKQLLLIKGNRKATRLRRAISTRLRNSTVSVIVFWPLQFKLTGLCESLRAMIL